jgi:hypothetical protein
VTCRLRARSLQATRDFRGPQRSAPPPWRPSEAIIAVAGFQSFLRAGNRVYGRLAPVDSRPQRVAWPADEKGGRTSRVGGEAGAGDTHRSRETWRRIRRERPSAAAALSSPAWPRSILGPMTEPRHPPHADNISGIPARADLPPRRDA